MSPHTQGRQRALLGGSCTLGLDTVALLHKAARQAATDRMTADLSEHTVICGGAGKGIGATLVDRASIHGKGGRHLARGFALIAPSERAGQRATPAGKCTRRFGRSGPSASRRGSSCTRCCTSAPSQCSWGIFERAPISSRRPHRTFLWCSSAGYQHACMHGSACRARQDLSTAGPFGVRRILFFVFFVRAFAMRATPLRHALCLDRSGRSMFPDFPFPVCP